METVSCKNCGNSFEGKFCNQCGQKNLTDKDKSFKHLLEEILHFLTHFEGSFIRTFKAVLFKPGKLSSDYCEGKRKPYYKPISFFLLVVVIYLLFPLASGMNMAMESYASNTSILGPSIKEQIAHKIQSSGLSSEALSEQFHHTSSKTSKLLLLLLIPFSALALYAFFFNHKKFAFDYTILATEFNAFMILGIFIVLPILFVLVIWLFRISTMPDNVLEPVLIAITITYTSLLFRRFFKEAWIWTILKAIGFCMLFGWVIMPLYRFIVFEVTFALI